MGGHTRYKSEDKHALPYLSNPNNKEDVITLSVGVIKSHLSSQMRKTSKS